MQGSLFFLIFALPSKNEGKPLEPRTDKVRCSKSMNKTFLIKVNGRLIDTATTKQELRDKANAYEKTIQGSRYKKEYCVYDEADGFHYGYDFTLFDEK